MTDQPVRATGDLVDHPVPYGHRVELNGLRRVVVKAVRADPLGIAGQPAQEDPAVLAHLLVLVSALVEPQPVSPRLRALGAVLQREPEPPGERLQMGVPGVDQFPAVLGHLTFEELARAPAPAAIVPGRRSAIRRTDGRRLRRARRCPWHDRTD
jgi:hypothetical protein